MAKENGAHARLLHDVPDFVEIDTGHCFGKAGIRACAGVGAQVDQREEAGEVTENEREALEERAAIIQFCSGREISRAESERIAAAQMGVNEEEMEFLMGENMEIK